MKNYRIRPTDSVFSRLFKMECYKTVIDVGFRVTEVYYKKY